MDYQKAIETLQDIHDVAEARIKSGDARGVVYINPNRLTDLKDAITAMQEMQAIHDQGIDPERLKNIDLRKQVIEHINYMDYMAIKDELEEYKQLGTLKIVRNAVERRNAKRVLHYGDIEDGEIECPHCHESLWDLKDCGFSNCPYCGQHIDWGEEDD